MELVAPEHRERGVLVVVGAFVDERLAGAGAGIEAGLAAVCGLGAERCKAEGRGEEAGGQDGTLHCCLLRRLGEGGAFR